MSPIRRGRYTVAALVGVFLSTTVALGFFVALPIFYGATSEGARPRS